MGRNGLVTCGWLPTDRLLAGWLLVAADWLFPVGPPPPTTGSWWLPTGWLLAGWLAPGWLA